MFQALVESLKAYSLRLRAPQPHRTASQSPADLAAPVEDRSHESAVTREQLRQARSLLQQAAHLARYHQPVLEHEIRHFLAKTSGSTGGRPAPRNLA